MRQSEQMKKKQDRISEWGRPKEKKKQKTLEDFEVENGNK